PLWVIGREESARYRSVSIGVVERDVQIRGERARRTNLLDSLDSGDFHLGDVDRCHDRGSWDSIVVDSRRAFLAVPGEFRDETEREPVYFPRLEKIVALWKRRIGCDSTLRNAGYGAQVF